MARTDCVAGSTDVATKDSRGGGEDLAAVVDELDGQADPQVLGFLHGDVDVDLEAGVLVDGGEDRRAGHAVADAHGDVAHHARGRRGDPVVGEGHALLADLRLRRRELGLARGERRLGLLQLRLAGRARLVQRLHARGLLLRVPQVGLAGGALRLQVGDRGLLHARVDVHERRAGAHAIPGAGEDPGDEALDLGLHRGGAPRLDGPDELGRLLHRPLDQGHDLHGHGERPARRPAVPPQAAAASARTTIT